MESTRTDWGSWCGATTTREIAIVERGASGRGTSPTSIKQRKNDEKRSGPLQKALTCCLKRRPSPAVRFGLRYSLGLTAASLFVIIPYPPGNTDEEYWPQGSWVFTTVVLCSWFPSQPVAASVVQKTYHRILGTTAGAVLGLAVGFSVAALEDAVSRGVFLGLTTALASFLWGFAAVQWKQLFGGYSYAAVLVLMTYGIVVWPFYLKPDDDEVWKRGGYRIGNVLIGCVISGLCAIVVFPKSTRSAIVEKEASQIRRAGMSSEAVLSAAVERFNSSNNNNDNNNNETATAPPPPPMRLGEIVREKISPDNKGDSEAKDTEVYDSYMAAMHECMSVRSLFSLLDYDPLHHLLCPSRKEQKMESLHDSAVNIARALRIQTTVVLLDSIIRNDEGHRFSAQQLELFARAGKLIKSILTERLDHGTRQTDAFELVSLLAQVRHEAIEAARQIKPISALSAKTIHSGGLDLEEFVNQLKNQDGGQPMCSQSAMILFFELVEHLILRVLRLYFSGTLQTPDNHVVPTNNVPTDRLFGWEGDDDFGGGDVGDAGGGGDDDDGD